MDLVAWQPTLPAGVEPRVAQWANDACISDTAGVAARPVTALTSAPEPGGTRHAHHAAMSIGTRLLRPAPFLLVLAAACSKADDSDQQRGAWDCASVQVPMGEAVRCTQ